MKFTIFFLESGWNTKFFAVTRFSIAKKEITPQHFEWFRG